MLEDWFKLDEPFTLNKRDIFTLFAMQGLLAKYGLEREADFLADRAVRFADATIEALKEK